MVEIIRTLQNLMRNQGAHGKIPHINLAYEL